MGSKRSKVERGGRRAGVDGTRIVGGKAAKVHLGSSPCCFPSSFVPDLKLSIQRTQSLTSIHPFFEIRSLQPNHPSYRRCVSLPANHPFRPHHPLPRLPSRYQTSSQTQFFCSNPIFLRHVVVRLGYLPSSQQQQRHNPQIPNHRVVYSSLRRVFLGIPRRNSSSPTHQEEGPLECVVRWRKSTWFSSRSSSRSSEGNARRWRREGRQAS